MFSKFWLYYTHGIKAKVESWCLAQQFAHLERAGFRRERTAHRGRKWAWPAPLLALTAAERDCDGRSRDTRAKLSSSVRSGSPSLSHLLQRGPGTREAASAESQRPRLRHLDRRKLGKEQERRRRNRSAAGALPLAAREKEREEESTGPRYERQHPLSTLTAWQHLTACVHTFHCVVIYQTHLCALCH